jgi:hypothetical protein
MLDIVKVVFYKYQIVVYVQMVQHVINVLMDFIIQHQQIIIVKVHVQLVHQIV